MGRGSLLRLSNTPVQLQNLLGCGMTLYILENSWTTSPLKQELQKMMLQTLDTELTSSTMCWSHSNVLIILSIFPCKYKKQKGENKNKSKSKNKNQNQKKKKKKKNQQLQSSCSPLSLLNDALIRDRDFHPEACSDYWSHSPHTIQGKLNQNMGVKH